MKASSYITLLALFAAPTHAATVWQPASNNLSSAAWDIFSFSSPNAGDSGSHGAAQSSTGSLITTSDLSTEITDSYDTPPGGFLGNPDTYYVHNGGFLWTAALTTSTPVSHVRVSYALFAGGMGGPSAFGNTPEITGATLINSGSYTSGNNTVFFTDLELATPGTSISSSFGDQLFPMFPGSFRSIDSVQVEVFDSAPVPEPSSFLLLCLGAFPLLRRKR